MRNLKELYFILLEFYKESLKDGRDGSDHRGHICNCIEFLQKDSVITDKEFDLLYSHFKSQRPTKDLHSEFYHHPFCKPNVWTVWFAWNDYSKPYGVDNNDSLGINIRIEFLEAIIKYL